MIRRLRATLARNLPTWTRLVLLGALVGMVGGAAAAAVEWGLHHGTALIVGRAAHDAMYSGRTFIFLSDSSAQQWQALAILLLPAMGGLISGLLVSWLCPNVTGHGTGMFINAFHRNLGRLDPRPPFVKMGAAVVVISAGGSTGPEGPVAGMGAAIGAWFGKAFRLTPRERRTLLVAGCAAGVGAIFRCPLGGALFAATILYREPEVESDAFIPSFMASVMGYAVFTAFWGAGAHLLIGADSLVFESFTDLLPYAILGPLCGLLSIFYVLCVRTVEERLRPAARLPAWLSPAVGGLLTGAIACCLPQVMDGRYEFIQAAMNGAKPAADQPDSIAGLLSQRPELTWWGWAGLFAAVAVFKCVATAFTVGSGASGGLLGPAVFIGGVAGAFLGAFFEAAAPGLIDEDLRKSLIAAGMAGVLASAMRTPLAAIVMLTEMTGSLGLVAPLMLVCVSSYLIGRRFGAHEEQLRDPSESPAHAADPIVRLLESGRVAQLMERPWPAVVPPDATLGDLVARMKSGTRPVLAVVRDGQLEGLISLADIRAITEEEGLAQAVIASDIMTRDLCTVHDDDTLYAALEEFKRFNHDVMPVLSRGPRPRWLGMLTRQRVYEAVRNQIADVQQSVLTEHAGLAMIHHEGQIAELMLGVAPTHKDRIQRIPVPLQAVGRSLREADFARRFGAQVVGIQDEKGEIQCPPDIDKPLRPDYELIAIVFGGPQAPAGG